METPVTNKGESPAPEKKVKMYIKKIRDICSEWLPTFGFIVAVISIFYGASSSKKLTNSMEMINASQSEHVVILNKINSNLDSQKQVSVKMSESLKVLNNEITWSNQRLVIRDNIYQKPRNYLLNAIGPESDRRNLSYDGCSHISSDGKMLLTELKMFEQLTPILADPEKDCKSILIEVLSTNYLQNALYKYNIKCNVIKSKTRFSPDDLIPVLGSILAYCREHGRTLINSG
jgi:hypothetical protein